MKESSKSQPVEHHKTPDKFTYKAAMHVAPVGVNDCMVMGISVSYLVIMVFGKDAESDSVGFRPQTSDPIINYELEAGKCVHQPTCGSMCVVSETDFTSNSTLMTKTRTQLKSFAALTPASVILRSPVQRQHCMGDQSMANLMFATKQYIKSCDNSEQQQQQQQQQQAVIHTSFLLTARALLVLLPVTGLWTLGRGGTEGGSNGVEARNAPISWRKKPSAVSMVRSAYLQTERRHLHKFALVPHYGVRVYSYTPAVAITIWFGEGIQASDTCRRAEHSEAVDVDADSQRFVKSSSSSRKLDQ
ncbi:hypothetical protein F2P81_017067, partial [Scophthalmus maximus]